MASRVAAKVAASCWRQRKKPETEAQSGAKGQGGMWSLAIVKQEPLVNHPGQCFATLAKLLQAPPIRIKRTTKGRPVCWFKHPVAGNRETKGRQGLPQWFGAAFRGSGDLAPGGSFWENKLSGIRGTRKLSRIPSKGNHVVVCCPLNQHGK